MSTITATRTNRLLAGVNADEKAKVTRPEFVPDTTVIRTPDLYDEGCAIWLDEDRGLVVTVDATRLDRLATTLAGSHMRMPKGISVSSFDPEEPLVLLASDVQGMRGRHLMSLAAWRAAEQVLRVA